MIPITVSTVVLIAVLSVLFHYSKQRRELVVFVGTSIGVGTGVIAAFGAAIQLRESTEQNRLALAHSRQEAAFTYLREWQALPLAPIRQLMRDAHGKSPEEVQRILVRRPQLHAAAEQMINYFEVLGLAVQRGYADETVLCSLMRDASMIYHDVLSTWFTWYRQMRGTPELFVHYDWLIARWKGGCPTAAASRT